MENHPLIPPSSLEPASGVPDGAVAHTAGVADDAFAAFDTETAWRQNAPQSSPRGELHIDDPRRSSAWFTSPSLVQVVVVVGTFAFVLGVLAGLAIMRMRLQPASSRVETTFAPVRESGEPTTYASSRQILGSVGADPARGESRAPQNVSDATNEAASALSPIPLGAAKTSGVQGEDGGSPLPPGVFRGALTVSSTPAGAEVFLNDRSVGVTPVRLPRVRAGSYAIRVELPGYETWTASVRVVANQENRATAPLSPSGQ